MWLIAFVIAQASAPASAQAAPRTALAEPSAAAKQQLRYAAGFGARGADVELGCQEPCADPPLAGFFAALDRLALGAVSERVAIVTFGNSLISSDNVTNVVRNELQQRFGDAGRGFVLVDRMAEYGPRTRTGHTPSGMWEAFNFALGPKSKRPFGVYGALHEKRGSGRVYTDWKLLGETRAELFFLDTPEAAPLIVQADGVDLVKIAPARDGMAHRLAFDIPEGAKKLRLLAPAGNATIYGLSLEKATAGIVADTFGVPAAEASTFLTADPEVAADQLRARDPKLLVFMLGGNEIRRLSFTRPSAIAQRKEQLAADLRAFIVRSRNATPAADCLVVGPIDAVYNKGPARLRSRPQTEDINAMEREVAFAAGCAFFDLFAAMGGRGSLAKFFERGMLHDDLVHPKGRGFDVLGELLADGLLRAYAGQKLATDDAAWARPRAKQEGAP